MEFTVVYGPGDTARYRGHATFDTVNTGTGYLTQVALGDSLHLQLFHLPSTATSLGAGQYTYTDGYPPSLVVVSRHRRLGTWIPAGTATVSTATGTEVVGEFHVTAIAGLPPDTVRVPVYGTFTATRCLDYLPCVTWH
jgi:hypothetical protein